MHLPSAASQHSTLLFPIGSLFVSALHVQSPLSYHAAALYCAQSGTLSALPGICTCPALCRFVTCHIRTIALASTKHTASIKLASAAEGATTAKPEALGRLAGRENEGGLQGAQEPTCPSVGGS